MSGRIAPLLLVAALTILLVAASRVPALGVVHTLALDVVSPIEELLFGSYQAAAGATRTLSAVDDLVAENERLRIEVESLRQAAIRSPELERENAQLRDLLGLRRQGPGWQLLEARVIGFDASNLVRSITVNRGLSDGVQDGMTVMTPRGLVGRVVHLGQSAARVVLISDPGVTANALVQRTRARGVIYGQRSAAGGHPLVMRYVPQGEDIKVGDTVMTSGLGGIFPDGIVIGQIASVTRRETDMFQEASIEPGAELDRLELVFIVTNHVPVKLD